MNNVVIKEPERPKMELQYEGLFGPKIDKIIIWVISLLYGLSIGLTLIVQLTR